MMQTRRRFLTSLAVAGTVALVRAPRAFAAEGALETTAVRLSKDLAICEVPLDVAEEFLRAEGFTDIRYVDTAADDVAAAVGHSKVDFALDFPVLFAPGIDAGEPITVLAGVHVGCFELFAGYHIQTVANLKGRTVGLKASPPALLKLIAAEIGLDPDKDIRWVNDPSANSLELFAQRKIDAFLGFPPSRRNCAPGMPAT
jgi:NitT/TauT family transport system substrate-binding protein